MAKKSTKSVRGVATKGKSKGGTKGGPVKNVKPHGMKAGNAAAKDRSASRIMLPPKPGKDPRDASGRWVPIYGSLIPDTWMTAEDREQHESPWLLCMRSYPTDIDRSPYVDQEFEEVESILRRGSQSRPRLDHVDTLKASGWARAVAQRRPAIVHFSGHGDRRGLILEDDADRTSVLVENWALEQMFSRLAGAATRLVVLNACYSHDAARRISRHLDFAVGMEGTIGERSAAAFSRGLYSALVEGCSVERSFRAGCRQLELLAPSEANRPRLFARTKPDVALSLI